MKIRISSRLIALGLSCLLSTATLLADGLTDLPIKTVGGRQYHYYEVKPKDTVYSLSKRFGITPDQLYDANPSVRDGLKAYEILLFPVENVSTDQKEFQSDTPRHHVKKGETIIGISRKYGVTTAQLFAWNPDARDGIKAGQYIYIGEPSAATQKAASDNHIDIKPVDETTASPEPGYTNYIVRDNETFYSIAKANGLTIAQLEAANPEIGVLHSGDRIRIPAINSPAPETESNIADVIINESDNATPPSSEITIPDITSSRKSHIALVLPLMHGQQPQPKQAQLYTEYLKGFLIAMDSLRGGSTPITLSVFDSYGSTDTLRNIMSRPEFKDANLIVAPDSETHLALLADYGRHNNIYVFNPFVVRDETYIGNPRLMQANIPQQQMYGKAIDGLITRYAHYTPVFVTREGAVPDKKTFVDELKERFNKAGITYTDLPFENKLERDQLSALPKEKPLLFILTSGRQPEANKVLPALVEFKNDGNDVMVFGYPEWTTFRGETLTNMYALNTVVYSRFFMAPDDPAATRLDGRFVYWYGKLMNNVLPRQGLLGFDSGMYLIEALRTNGGDFSRPLKLHEGIQNSFHFIVPLGCEGMVNDVLYFINYKPGEIIDGTLL